MNQLSECTVQCPYCWESINVLIDPEDIDEVYIEDCQVCCRPINFSIGMDEQSGITVSVSHEDN